MTGGYNYDNGLNFFSSTEMMQKGASSWTEVPDSLPARMSELASISVNNQIITTGKLEKLEEIICSFDQKYQLCILFSGGYDEDARARSDKILMFNKETRKFEQIGNMEQRRISHSMSLVSLSDYNCQ